MSLKAKLVSVISAFVLILTLAIVSVWAVSQANVTMSGTVGFKADNVYAKISAEITGMEEKPTLPTLIFSEGADASSEPDVEKWSNLDLLFNSSATPIEISVTVENLSTERWLLVDIIEGLDNGKSDNINKEVKKENSDYTLGETHTLVPSTGDGTSKVEFTITLTVDNSNYSADTIYSYIINLNNSNEAPPEPAKELDFTFSGNKVTCYTGNETNITIPTSYSMEESEKPSFVFTAGEFGLETPEARNKAGMLYALKNYTVYILDGQSEGVFCENFADYESLQGRIAYPFRVEFSEDLTFELTEEEMGGGQVTEETEFKLKALEFLQNFYVQFGENPEEILCQDYDDFVSKFNEIMPEGPKPEYFPLKFRIDYASYKYVEGDDYQVEAIGAGAFINCSSLTSITIPEGVRGIGEQAFAGCSSLTSITIPEGVREIGEQAFANCDNLTSITLPNSLEVFGSPTFDDFPKNLQNQNFYTEPTTGDIYFGNSTNNYLILIEVADKTITDFDFPEGCKIVLEGAFLECTELTSIEIPEGITQISGFTNCSNLASVSLPSTLISIGKYAFSGCSSLTTITIPEGVTEIGNFAFSGCSNLTSISIPKGVTSIGYEAFRECSSLTEITIPEGVTSIGGYAFRGCISLTSVSLPSTLTSIDDWAFRDCSSLTEITIPEGVTSIGRYAFGGCSSLTSVSLPSTLSSIDIVFQSCSNLTEITINGNITSLESYTFEGCGKLTSLTLGEGVTSLPRNLFADYNNLTNLTKIVVLGNLNSSTFPSGTWVKDGGSETVTSFTGAGTYTRTDIQ